MFGVDVLVCRNDVGDLVSIWLEAADELTGSTARYEVMLKCWQEVEIIQAS